MKLKITNPWIPTTLLSLGFLGGIIAFLTESDVIAGIGGILVFVASVSLVLVYFPILTIKLIGNKIENKEKVVTNIGIFTLSFFLLGILLRLWQLPGGGIITVVGSTVFYLNFIPSWYASNYKKWERLQRWFNFIFCTILGMMVMAFQFKTMHWPFGNLLTNITYNSGLFILFPFALFVYLFKREKKYISVGSTFVFGFIIAYIIGGTINIKIANRAFTSNNKAHIGIENNLRLYEAKNKFIYEAFEKNNNDDSVYSNLKKKAIELKLVSNNQFNYLKKLKTDIVIETNNLPETFRDSITFDNILDKTNYDIPTYMLIGQDATNPRTDSGSSFALRRSLEKYIKALDSIIPEEHALQLKQSNPFDFSDIETEGGGKEKWEIINFYHEPLSTVYTNITGYQANVRYLEMTVLNELFNKANANNKDNMASKLVELAMKYETAKQEKKISMLQKDQEMTDVKMQAKDAEISNRENTITLFIFGAIIFGVLMVFVIRSNILRKQTNKELAAQKDVITAQKNEVEGQKHLIEEKQKEIVDSITYAKRLQEAILPAQEIVNKHLPENFILYSPKDLVAGDFYWMEVINEGDKEFTFIAAADSTGHGVPGAMVSVVCSNALNRAVLEFKLTQTGQILDKTRELVLETFSKSTTDVKDGMDISLLAVIRKNNEIIEINWSGANNPLWFIENNEVKEVKANKQPIGKTDNPTPFTTHSIPYVKGTSFYLFTDGYADQFGGPKGKKFKYKQLEELLLELSTKQMSIQKETLNSKFEDWKLGIEQVDDVCVIGIKL